MAAGSEDGYGGGGFGTSWETVPHRICGPIKTVLHPLASAAERAASEWVGIGRRRRRIGEEEIEGGRGTEVCGRYAAGCIARSPLKTYES